MTWDRLKSGMTGALPPVPGQGETTVDLKGPIRRPDGRTVRKTDRQKQFNPRVSPYFLARFSRAQAFEEQRAGEKITQSYFLELLLSMYERAQGQELHPFGLSAAAHEAAQTIAGHMGWDLSTVIEDAIAARLKYFNLTKETDEKR